MPEKVKGTVKWFSNRKGFGFITPSSDNAPTIEDIFVHQSNIVTEKETYRTLKDGFEVEFEVITDTNGKLKAENVTSDDGSPCPGPEPRERRKRNKNKGLAGESGDENGGEKSDEEPKDPAAKGRGRRRNGKKGSNEKKPSWEDDLDESVKEGMESRKIKILAGKTFLAIGDARVKLGNGGYAAFAHTSGMIAEGTFTYEKNGEIITTWNHVMKLDGYDWVETTVDEEKDIIISEIDLNDDSIEPTEQEDGINPVWGEGKSDPKEALEKNGFQLRKVAFAHLPRRRGPGRRNNNTKIGGDEKPAEEAKEE